MWTIGRAKIEDSRPKSTGDHPSKLEFQSLGQGTKPDMTATVKNKHTNVYLRFLRLQVQRHLRTHTSELHEHTWLYTLLGCHENDTEDHNLPLSQLVFKTNPDFWWEQQKVWRCEVGCCKVMGAEGAGWQTAAGVWGRTCVTSATISVDQSCVSTFSLWFATD